METTKPAKLSGNAAMGVRFRLWRERNLPKAAYRMEPRFWTQAGRQFAEGLPDWQCRASKVFEPRVTGIAWTSHRMYLVIATAAASYDHAAQLIHARDLIRLDRDYAEHAEKRLSMILLADTVEPPIDDFCRRHRVRVCAPVAAAGAEAATPLTVTDTKTDTATVHDSGNGSVRG